MDFVKKVSKVIKENDLLDHRRNVVVALSGGADSVALLAVLTELGYDCTAAHCNFHLRGEESNRDMRFVETLTSQLGVNLYVREFNVAERMAKTGESVEMACRSLRYDWFFELLDRDRAQAIAVGHHREDQAETFFINLLRGAGIAGLAGMRLRSEHVVRPLLNFSREDIETYLRSRGLNWITDSTNLTDEFLRNRVRHRLLPALEQQFPGAMESVLRSMSILRDNDELFKDLVGRAASKYRDDATGEINLDAMLESEKYPGSLLFEMLKHEGFSRQQTDDMLTAASRSGGSFRAGSSHVREVDHGILRAARAGKPVSSDAYDISLMRDVFSPVAIQITFHDVKEFCIENNPRIAYIDSHAMEGIHRWQLRRWRRGDRMKPYGMRGSKLLSDIFADARLSAQQKAETWLLTRDEEILWVCGIRASSLFTVGPSTRNYLRLELK